MGLDVDGQVQLDVGFEWELGFGLDKNKGFYIVTGYEDIRKAASDPKTFSSVTGQLLVKTAPYQERIDAIYREKGYMPVTALVVADPPIHSFHRSLVDKVFTLSTVKRMEEYLAGVVDEMVCVPDAASIATMRWLSARLGRTVGPSTGTNVWAALGQIARMRAAGEPGSVVTLLCDGGERYRSTYYDDAWIAARGIDLRPWTAALAEFDATGAWPDH